MLKRVEKMVVLIALFDTRLDEAAEFFLSLYLAEMECTEASEDETDFELTCALALATLNG